MGSHLVLGRPLWRHPDLFVQLTEEVIFRYPWYGTREISAPVLREEAMRLLSSLHVSTYCAMLEAEYGRQLWEDEPVPLGDPKTWIGNDLIIGAMAKMISDDVWVQQVVKCSRKEAGDIYELTWTIVSGGINDRWSVY